MASTLQLETPEQKRLRIEQEKLQQQMGNIGFSSIESPAPVETTETTGPPVPTVREEFSETYTLPATVESTEAITSPDDTVPVFDWEQMIAPIKQVQESFDPSKPYSVEDLELGKGPRNFEGESFNKVAERYLSSIGEREDIFETMRDSEWSVGDAIALGIKSKNWTAQQKKDYAFLKSTWDSAELNDWGQILEATKDIGIDIIADPANLFFAYLTLQTGGATVLALSGASRIATNQAVKQGLKRVANNGTFRASSIGLTEGAYDGAMINLGNQLTEVNTELRTEVDKKELGLSAGIAGTAGLILVPSAYKFTNYLLRRKTQKVLDDLQLDMEKGPLTKEKFNEYNETREFFDAITSNSFGKATTRFIEVSKESPAITQFILGLNPKAMQRILGARKEVIDAPIRATSRPGDLGYATDQEALSSLYTTFIDEVLDPQIFGRVRDRDGSWFNLGTALDTNDNLSLAYLLTKGDLLDDYIKVIPKNPNKPFVNLQVQSKVKNVVPDSRITDLQEKYGLEFNEKMFEAAAKIRYFFKQIEVDAKNIYAVQPDGSFKLTALLDEEQSIPNYFHRILDYEAIMATPESRKIFRDMLVRSGHADPINTVKKDDIVLVEEAVKMKGSGGREKDIPDIARSPRRTAYIEDNTIDKEYFKDLDSPFYEGQKILERFDSFEDLALDVLRKENGNLDEASILQRAKELKADALMRKLKEEKYFKTTARTASGGKTEFLNNRVWYMLDDEELISNGFINTNMLPLLKDYAYKMGQKITETKYFGFGSNFERNWIPKIIKELENSKKFSDKEIKKIANNLIKTKEHAVNSPNTHLDFPTWTFHAADLFRTSQILAHLPVAAATSITEPFVALGKADLLSDTPSWIKEYGKAGILQIRKNLGYKNGRLWDQIRLSSGKKVYGFKDLTDEDFLDVKRWGVAVEQAMLARIEGMFSQNIRSRSLRNLNNMFFNITLLQPWTQAVQMGSFNFAKARSIRITRELTEGKNQFGKKLTKNEIEWRREQLHEIGIDFQDSINAYKSSIINGKFDLQTFQDHPFYDTQLNPGSQQFAKEVILNPSASNMNKPLWFNNTFAQLAVQFANYPTAFNNTILKGFARDLYRYPVQSAPNILAATTMMIGTAHLMNTVRSRGENLKNDDQTLLLDAIERPGLLGPLTHAYRYHRGTQYKQGWVSGITKAFGGPLIADYVDAVQYSSSPYTVGIQQMPFWGALSPKTRRDLRKWAAKKHHQHWEDPKQNIRAIKRKGGVVEDVLNVTTEPDELKMRGLPYSYSELAGHLFQDEEERGAFAEGGNVSTKEIDDTYNYLTKDEDEYNVLIDKDPIRIYTKETLPNLNIKETYYTGFKGNTVSDRLNSVRQSSTIGLPVTKDKTKARGNVKAAGKIKFNNVLKLNIDSVTPDSVQAEINNNMDSIIKIEDKVLGKEIINATTDNLKIRDAVLNKDNNVTTKKKRIIERNKSFLVRHQLLKLGYDALETNEGYTLLRENQFLPTEITERTKAYGGGMVSTLNRRQQYDVGGFASKLPLNLRLEHNTPIDGGDSYGDVIVQDYKEALQGLKDMLTDPVGMIDNVAQLGLGAIALAIPDEYQERKLDQYEDLAKGVGQVLVDNFGTLEKAKQTIINNPVDTAAGVASLLFGGGYGLKKIADAAKVSKASQAGSKMMKASDAVDPIIGPILGAGKLITRRDFNKGVGVAALASAIPASKVLDEVGKVKTVKKLTGISRFRNIYDNIGYALKGSKQRDDLIDELTNEALKDKTPTLMVEHALEYGDTFETQLAIDRKLPEIGYEASTPDYIRTRGYNRNYYTGTKTTDIINNFQKSFKLNNKDFVEILPERLKIDTKESKLNNTIKELINSFNKTSNKKTYKNEELFASRNTPWNPDVEDYSEITKVTTAVIEGVPVIKVQTYSYYPSGHRNWSAEEFKKSQFVKFETTSHPEFKKTNYEKTDEIYYIPNESGLEKLANLTKTITKRDMLTGLRDRNNKGGEIRQQYGLGGRLASKLAERLSRKVMPAPQRFFDEKDKAYKPFLKDFEYTEGGRYLEMDQKGPRDITGEYPKQANISVDSEGKASLSISKEIFKEPPETSGKIIRTNLFKKKAGWKWLVTPKGFDPNPQGNFPIISVETGNKHYYSLSTDFPEGVQLSRYDKKKSEPRLRPTTKGNLKFGNVVGKISVRGKEHPVYDNLTVESLLDNKQQFNKGGLVRKIIIKEND